MTTRMGLTVLRIVLGLVVGGYSLLLVVRQLQGHPHPPLVVLGMAELGAAALLLIPRTVRIGGISLIVVFALAALFHVLHRDYDLGFLAVYGAAAFAIVSARTPA